MYSISKTFSFSASHALDQLPDSHKCHNLHGHNYEVTLTLESPVLDGFGFVVDYGELSDFKELLDREFDHQHLNDKMSATPTAENLARYLYDQADYMYSNGVARVKSVTVCETPKTAATYERSNDEQCQCSCGK